MDTLVQDIRYAARRLSRSPGFSLAAILTLALGIGSSSAIFSVVSGVLLRPLPFSQPDRIDRIFTTHAEHGRVPTAPPDFMQLQAESQAYESLAAYTLSTPNLTGSGDPVRLEGTEVSASFFAVLGVRPAIGRTFLPEENEPGRGGVVVLSSGLWQQRFGGDPEVIGRSVQLDGEPFEIVGVMAPEFDFPGDRQIWKPLVYSEVFRDDAYRLSHSLSVIGRRKPEVELDAATADVNAVARRIGQHFPEKVEFGATAVGLHEYLVGDVRTPLLGLFGAVVLVLLIACVNVANLLLARAAAREGELAVRAALGADRGRLIRQLMTESVLLGLLGGALGLLLAFWGTDWLASISYEGLPRLAEVRLDWTVVAFTAALSILTGLLFGLFPAARATRGALAGGLKEGGRGALSARGTTRVRSTLVAVETAFAVMLLAGAGLLMRSFAELRAVDPGFRAERALAFDVSLPAASYGGPVRVETFYRELSERLRSLPGVESVGASSSLPGGGFFQRSPLVVQGETEPSPGEEGIVEVRVVTPGYFAALGVPVIRGRGVLETDRDGSAPVVVLSAGAAERFFAGQDPIGKRVALQARGEPLWAEVVGVAGDIRDLELSEPGRPSIYFPHSQRPIPQMSLIVRTSTDANRLVPLARQELSSMDPNLPVFNVRTVDQIMEGFVAEHRFYMLLLAIFAGAALLLASIGIFGVVANVVAQRTREIGIRMALGADPGRVLRLVVTRTVGLVLAGVLVGLAGASLGARLLAGLLFGVGPNDPLTLLGVVFLLVLVAAAASYVPARRAVRVDPMLALRGE